MFARVLLVYSLELLQRSKYSSGFHFGGGKKMMCIDPYPPWGYGGGGVPPVKITYSEAASGAPNRLEFSYQ